MNINKFYSQIIKTYQQPETKDNHLVPQFLLRNFCHNNPNESIYLNTFTNKKAHPKIKNGKANFKNKFSNQIIFNDSLEKYFSNIENLSAPLIKKMAQFSNQYLKYTISSLNNYNINNYVNNLHCFQFNNQDIDNICKLYSSIFIRILMNSSLNDTQILQKDTLINEVSNNVLKQLFSCNNEENIKIINSLNNFKKKLINVDSNHFIQSFNEFYYEHSNAKTLLLDYLKSCFLNNKVVLISWEAAVLPISNSLPFSWINKILYLPISANSILYIDQNIDNNNYSYIQNNSIEIIKQYRDYIENNAYEFLYYDKGMAEIRGDYSLFKY